MFKRLYRPYEINAALQLYCKNHSFRKTAVTTGISKSSIHRWYKIFGETGIKKRSIQRKKNKTKKAILHLQKLLRNEPCQTLLHLSSQFEEPKPSVSTVSRCLKKMKYKYRKVLFHQVECNQLNCETKIKEFIENVRNIDTQKVVSLDEVGFRTTELSMFGYSTTPIHKEMFNAKRQKFSCCMAITSNGLLHYNLIKESAFNKCRFYAFIKVLIPLMLSSGKDILIMDNINFHHSKIIKHLLSEHNIKIIYTPPYSPQFNPIEIAFSIIKRDFKKLLYSKVSVNNAINLAIHNFDKGYKDKTTSIFTKCLIDECHKSKYQNESKC